MTFDGRFLAVLICFLLSGFAALLYETAWTREFAFVFGTSEVAIATVLAAYMAGLALGAAVAGRLAPRVRRPVLVYGLLEGGIAAVALAVPLLIRGTLGLSVALFGGAPEPQDEGAFGAGAFYTLCAFAILLLPTAFMGATLPLLTRYAVRDEREIGSRIGLLYAVNTAGAVLGAVGAGFFLLPGLGLRSTVYVGVAVNIAVFLLAALLARGVQPIAPPEAPPAASPDRRQWVLILMTFSGIASFTYEILWIRLLSQVLGSSVYAFATMLGSFIGGIAIGSGLASRVASDPLRSATAFAIVELLIAAASLVAFALLDSLPGWAVSWGAGPGMHHRANAAIAALILLPSALFIGATFPFAVRVLARDRIDAVPASARVYAWNTLGAIVGSLGTGLFLLSALGFRGTLVFAVAINVVLAATAALALSPLRRVLTPLIAAGGALVLVLAVRAPLPWTLLGTGPLDLANARPPENVLYFAVGRSATVLATDQAGFIRLRANGLPESVVRTPGWYELSGGGWFATLPAALRPDAREMLVIGLGGGTLLETIPETIERIDVIELEREIVRANREIGPRRGRDPLLDPRIRVVVNDARGALLLTEKRYDAIVSQPSHPWTPGASHLYTREFFASVRAHLGPGGVFAQWMNLGLVDLELFRGLAATLLEVFPHAQVYVPHPYTDAYLLASDEPLDWKRQVRRFVDESPEAAAQLGFFGPEDLLLALALDEPALRAFAVGGVVNSDDHNQLQTRPVAKLTRPDPRWASALLSENDPLRSLDGDLERGYLARRLLSRGDAWRVQRMLPEPDPARQALLSVLLDSGRSGTGPVRARLAEVLREHPASEWAQVAFIEASHRELAANTLEPWIDTALSDTTRALVRGWNLLLTGRGPEIAGFDVLLEDVPVHHPGYAQAAELRVGWRVQSPDPDHLREAVAILEQLLLVDPALRHQLVRARALAELGAYEEVLGAAAQILSQLFVAPQALSPAEWGGLEPVLGAILDRIPDQGQLGSQRRAIRGRLRFLARRHGA